MPTSLPRTPLAGFGTAVVLVILANLVFYWLLEEVNRKRAAGDQISRFFVNARAFEIIRLHKEFTPKAPTEPCFTSARALALDWVSSRLFFLLRLAETRTLKHRSTSKIELSPATRGCRTDPRSRESGAQLVLASLRFADSVQNDRRYLETI
jgi:hypothetical protein